MATIKSCSDLQQSKKLAEILPLESADMVLLHEEPYETSDSKFDGLHQVLCVPFNEYSKSWRQKYKNIYYFPCWSLAALISILPKIGSEEPMIQKLYYANNPTERYICQYSFTNITGEYDNPVEACVAVIEKLHKLKML